MDGTKVDDIVVDDHHPRDAIIEVERTNQDPYPGKIEEVLL